jgi:hypothetical protein
VTWARTLGTDHWSATSTPWSSAMDRGTSCCSPDPVVGPIEPPVCTRTRSPPTPWAAWRWCAAIGSTCHRIPFARDEDHKLTVVEVLDPAAAGRTDHGGSRRIIFLLRVGGLLWAADQQRQMQRGLRDRLPRLRRQPARLPAAPALSVRAGPGPPSSRTSSGPRSRNRLGPPRRSWRRLVAPRGPALSRTVSDSAVPRSRVSTSIAHRPVRAAGRFV